MARTLRTLGQLRETESQSGKTTSVTMPLQAPSSNTACPWALCKGASLFLSIQHTQGGKETQAAWKPKDMLPGSPCQKWSLLSAFPGLQTGPTDKPNHPGSSPGRPPEGKRKGVASLDALSMSGYKEPGACTPRLRKARGIREL